MQHIVLAKPYHFVPPRFSGFWGRIIQWWLPTYLRKSFGVTSWECVGTEPRRASLRANSGVLLASNHCRPCDPMMLAMLSCVSTWPQSRLSSGKGRVISTPR
jgi:hypothetical protein